MGVNQVSTLYLDQNLLPLISHVKTNLGCAGLFPLNPSPPAAYDLCLTVLARLMRLRYAFLILSLTFSQLFVMRKLSS